MAGPLDLPGNSLQSVANYQRRMIRLGETLMRIEPVLESLFDEDVELRSVTVKFPTEETGDYFVIARAYEKGKPVVAFHAAQTFAEAVEGWANRLKNRSLRWKADMYGDTKD